MKPVFPPKTGFFFSIFLLLGEGLRVATPPLF